MASTSTRHRPRSAGRSTRSAYAEGTFSPGVNFVVSDVFEVDLPPEHFDGAFVSNFLEHLPSQEHVADLLGRLHAAMAPGGRLAIMGPNFRYTVKEYWDYADHTLALTHAPWKSTCTPPGSRPSA